MATPIKQIQVGGTNYNIRGYFYGTCSTAEDDGTKVVVCPEFTADDLTDGTLISISFSYELDSEEAGIISLNVNNTGDKALLAVINGQINSYIYFYNVSTILCTYSSTLDSWIIVGPSQDNNNTYTAPMNDRIQGWTVNRYASCSTAAGTAAKTASVTNGSVTLSAGLAVYVKFTNANTANSPTLNINSKGAKNIFYNGAQITTGSEKSLLKGLCLFVYDGTQWHLIPSSAGPSSTVPSHTHSLTTENANVSGTVTANGVVTGSVSGKVLTLGFSGTAVTPALSYVRVTGVGTSQ